MKTDSTGDWNADLYMRFADERSQPARDLAARIQVQNPEKGLDIGCGPGNSTAILHGHFPEMALTGIDNSENMLDAARAKYPYLDFRHLKITPECTEITEQYDIIFSNACLHWIPEHKTLIPALYSKTRENGVLALQIPLIDSLPITTMLDHLKAGEKWHGYIGKMQPYGALSPEEYYDIAVSTGSRFAIWKTEYMHTAENIDEIIQWYSGSVLRPYIHAIPEKKRLQFTEELRKLVPKHYSPRPDGSFVLSFARLFLVINKGKDA